MGEEAKNNLVRLKVFFDVQGESELQGRLELGKQRLLESRCDINFPQFDFGKIFQTNPFASFRLLAFTAPTVLLWQLTGKGWRREC